MSINIYLLIFIIGNIGFIICLIIMLIRVLKGKNAIKRLNGVLSILFFILLIYGICGKLGFLPKINGTNLNIGSNVKNNENISQSTSENLSFYTMGNSKNIIATEEIAKNKKAVILIQCGDSLGSGFIINNSGYVVTNYHVINGSNFYTGVFQNEKDEEGRKIPLNLIAFSEEKDIALLKLDSNEKFSYMIFGNSDKILDGQKIITIGSPKGIINSISDGIVSGIRKMDNTKYIQITAALSPGNSGGVLLNMSGEVIGMNTFKIKNAENLNFAIASSEIISFLDSSLVKDTISGSKNKTNIELSDKDILAIINNSQNSFFNVIHGISQHQYSYGVLNKNYDSPQKLQDYLKQYFTSNASKDFIDFIGAKYINNKYCIKLGDATKVDLLNAKVLKKQQIDNKIYINLSAYNIDLQDYENLNQELKFENNKWLVDYFEGSFGKIGHKSK